MIKLSGAASFTWSTSEQVYPFEKTEDGKTIYAKMWIRENFSGATGTDYIPHGLTDPTYCFKLWADYRVSTSFANSMENVTNPSYALGVDIYLTNIRLAFITNVGQPAGTAKVYMLYTK